MGLFGSLFGEKSCGVCGKELGLLGKRKLEDGYICKDCANLLSPFFGERRSSTLNEIKEQLDYREQNKASVAAFNVTRTLGTGMKILLDEDAGNFIATRVRNWHEINPDVIPFSAVTGCNVEVKEHRTEVKRELEDGKKESYDPPRWDLDYEVWVTINVNNPYFDEIKFKTNDFTIEERYSVQFQESERIANEIREALTQICAEASGETWTCSCGASNTGSFCANCGSKCPEPAEWVCQCGTKNTGNFCTNCGDKRP